MIAQFVCANENFCVNCTKIGIIPQTMENKIQYGCKFPRALLFAIVCLLFSQNSAAIDLAMVSEAGALLGQPTDSHVGILPKDMRLNKFGSDIKINHSELPDSILKCVLFAKDIWESSIYCSVPIIIDLEYKPIGPEIEIDVTYLYTEKGLIPNTLYKSQVKGADNLTDGIIRINSNVEWNCSVATDLNSGCPNLTFALLRSFAKIFGFSSAIRKDNDGMLYWSGKRQHTIFDKCIKSSDNMSICDYGLNRGKPSRQLTDFLSSENRQFYFGEKNSLYELEKTPFSDGSVLSYFKDDNSMMSFNRSKGSCFLRVDSLIRSVLKEFGWGAIKRPAIEIVCDEAGDNGIMSAYSSHSFRIKSDANASVTAPRWQLSLPLADGNEEKILLNDTGFSCTIPAIENEGRYLVNVNGDIYACLNFSCQINGTEVHADQYRISLELKPSIEYINIVDVKQYPDQQTYDIKFEVKYHGSDHIDISVEEEYGSWLKNKSIYEPFWAQCVCEQIPAPFSAWIDFSVANEYGTAGYTVELDPNGEVVNSFNHNDNTDVVESKRFDSKRQMYYAETDLPEKPAIENVQFDIVYDWEHEDFPQPKESSFKFDVYYYNTERVYLLTNIHGQYHSSEKPSFMGLILSVQKTDDPKSGLIHFEVPDTDWGECFAVACYNKQGVAWSDTINTSDYVKDPVLIDYINDYWDKQSGFGDIEQDSPDIIFRDENIICSSEIRSLSIYSLSGIAVRQFSRPGIVAIGDLPKGLYIIAYTTNSNSSRSIKYLRYKN